MSDHDIPEDVKKHLHHFGGEESIMGKSSLAPAPGSPKIVLVPMSPAEALKLLDNLTKNMPHPLPFNFQHKQWDLMLPNLEALERDISRAKRVLAALSENKD